MILSLTRWRRSTSNHPHLTLANLRDAFVKSHDKQSLFKKAFKEYNLTTADHHVWRNKIYAHGDTYALANTIKLPELTLESVDPAIAALDKLIEIIGEELPDPHKSSGVIDNSAGTDLVTTIQICNQMHNIQTLFVRDNLTSQERLDLIANEAFRKPDFADGPAE